MQWASRIQVQDNLFVESVKIEIVHKVDGRALLVDGNGTFYLGKNSAEIFSSTDSGHGWDKFGEFPDSIIPEPFGRYRLLNRLLRNEIRTLVVYPDGAAVAGRKDGIFYKKPDDLMLKRSAVRSGKLEWHCPLNIAIGPEQQLLWGEYSPVSHKNTVEIFISEDRGKSFEVAFVLDEGMAMHIHNLLYDETIDAYWVFLGDFGHEAGIGILSRDLQRFEWFLRGEQRFRLVNAFDLGDHLVYATD